VWQKFCIGIATQIVALSLLILIFLKKVEIIVFYPERNKIVFEKDKISVSSGEVQFVGDFVSPAIWRSID